MHQIIETINYCDANFGTSCYAPTKEVFTMLAWISESSWRNRIHSTSEILVDLKRIRVERPVVLLPMTTIMIIGVHWSCVFSFFFSSSMLTGIKITC